MKLSQLECFQAAAKCGSFSAAAQSLYLSQPAVSKQIRALEQEWGFPLFHRKAHSVVLTLSGQVMLEHFRQSTIGYEAALEQAKNLSLSEATMVLNMGVFEGSHMAELPNQIEAFQRRNPRCSVSLESRGFYSLGQGLINRRYDVIITYAQMLEETRDLAFQLLKTVPFVAYLSKTHPLAQRRGLTFAHLAEEPFYVAAHDDNRMTHNLCASICAAHGFRPRVIKSVPNVESQMMAVRLGQGAALLTTEIAIPNASRFLAIPTDARADIILAWRRDIEATPVSSVIQDFLRHMTQGESL